LVGPCATNDREVGKETGVEGGGQQKCVAEVTCVVWRWMVLLSNVVPMQGGFF
jgi:hypothetical protein